MRPTVRTEHAPPPSANRWPPQRSATTKSPRHAKWREGTARTGVSTSESEVSLITWRIAVESERGVLRPTHWVGAPWEGAESRLRNGSLQTARTISSGDGAGSVGAP
ncbi:Hypothetical protein A7982_04847 [Minicystis rosea]|nr:Hypothetical protein A7982_04847 [Minicystis rosea]